MINWRLTTLHPSSHCIESNENLVRIVQFLEILYFVPFNPILSSFLKRCFLPFQNDYCRLLNLVGRSMVHGYPFWNIEVYKTAGLRKFVRDQVNVVPQLRAMKYDVKECKRARYKLESSWGNVFVMSLLIMRPRRLTSIDYAKFLHTAEFCRFVVHMLYKNDQTLCQ